MGADHHTYAYRKARKQLRAKRLQPCALCGRTIDYRLVHPDPGSFAAEHVIPVHAGGGHDHLVPSHLDCQRVQGGEIATALRWEQAPPVRTSGVW